MRRDGMPARRWNRLSMGGGLLGPESVSDLGKLDVFIIRDVVQTPVDDVDLLLPQIQQHLFLPKPIQREVVSRLGSLGEESLHLLEARRVGSRDPTVVHTDAPVDDSRIA